MSDMKRADGTGCYLFKGGVAYKLHNINGKMFQEHRLIAEKALGRPLPDKVVVHHWHGNPPTFVICPDQKYHMLIHKRERQVMLVNKSLAEALNGPDKPREEYRTRSIGHISELRPAFRGPRVSLFEFLNKGPSRKT